MGVPELRRALGALALLPALLGAATQLASAEENSLSLSTFFVQQSDGGGNPFISERADIDEPILILTQQIVPTWSVRAQLLLDTIHSADEGTALSGTGLTTSGSASRRIERRGVDVSVSHNPRGWGWTLGSAQSMQSDYVSGSLSGSAKLEVPGGNTTLGASASLFHDHIETTQFDGASNGWKDRYSANGGLSWTQILSPDSSVTLSLGVSRQSGVLHSPRQFVVFEDAFAVPHTQVPELLQDHRTRRSFGVRSKTWFDSAQAALELDARLYTDTWGIRAVAAEVQWAQDLWDGDLTLRPRIRYSTQTAADGFAERFVSAIGDPINSTLYKTQDSDLGAFTTTTFGVKATLNRADWLRSDSMEISAAADVYSRSDGVSGTIATFTITLYY